MEQAYAISREDLYNLQMEVKQVQYAQSNHAERISRLEKRQTDDSAIKSAWNSPFPGVLSTTPQHGKLSRNQFKCEPKCETNSGFPLVGPIHSDVFDDLDEQGDQLLGSLHLGPAEEEPVRRGTSRANSVRFDESALHGSGWNGAAAQSNRHSGDFGSMRPGSGLLMERTLSHKSDGRHSSAGHSVHSHHSVASGRASSVGLDADDESDDSFEVPEPPVSLYVLGSVPSLIRCWLTLDFAHGTLLYADVCSGAQKSTISHWLLEDLELIGNVQRDPDDVARVRLDVYFAEAVVTQRSSQPETPGGLVPSITVPFEVVGGSRPEDKKSIGIFIGSDALRAHTADILFSQNTMALYGNNRDRVRVPFVRPEEESVFKHLITTNKTPEKLKLNAGAAPFVLGDATLQSDTEAQLPSPLPQTEDQQSPEQVSPTATHAQLQKPVNNANKNRDTNDNNKENVNGHSSSTPDTTQAPRKSEVSKRDVANAIWSPWRHGGSNGNERDSSSISGYQPPPPPRGRNMKVLKSGKSGSSSTRTGQSYERAPSGRRKSQASVTSDSGNGSNKWEQKRAAQEAKAQPTPDAPKASNPVGGGSAFSWMPGVRGGKPDPE